MAGAVPCNRNVVNEVDERDMGTVEDRWTDVVFPTQIRIGDVIQVKTVSTVASSRVNRTCQSIGNLQLKVTCNPAPQLGLQRIVMRVAAVESLLDGGIALVGY